MTDLQKLYLEARNGGRRGHHAALRAVSDQTTIDKDTVQRCLDRARKADAIDARRLKKNMRKVEA